MSASARGNSHVDRLLQVARQGDGKAFWQLAEGYRPYLKTVAHRILGDRLPSDGSDVVDQSLTIGFERMAQFHGEQPAAFLGWLAAIVRNESLRRLGREGRFQPLPKSSGDEVLIGTDSSSPDSRAQRRERAARLLALVERLPESERTVIDLRNLQELSFAEVAQRMARSYDAVRQLWMRAMRRLRQEWGDDL